MSTLQDIIQAWRKRERKRRPRRRWLRQEIPIEHRHSAQRRLAGLSNAERQIILDKKRERRPNA